MVSVQKQIRKAFYASQGISAKKIVIFLLIASTLSVYWQVGGHDFINYDDPAYVYGNPQVKQGITLSSIAWSFTSIYASNWHPVTWLSHMLDVQLFGMNPAGHHFVSLALHISNAVLLLLLLCRLTGALWQSAVVAALFALHPLHVESVAWVAERKDVLSTLFGMLTLYLYAGYVENRKLSRYILALVCFVLGLMAKPMLVTLPFVMLLLDYWPLERLEAMQSADKARDVSASEIKAFGFLIKEKAPFFALIVISCVVTLFAQQRGASIQSLKDYTLSGRIANALLTYLGYIGKMFWPLDLAVLYPYVNFLPFWKEIAVAGLLVAITFLTVRERRRRPYLMVGWLWYIGTLVPVIGIVQVGSQSMADRYTYVPLIGIFIMLVWGVADISAKWVYRRILLTSLVLLVILGCSILTSRQLHYWQNNFTLYDHTLAVTSNNYNILINLGVAYEDAGNYYEAINFYKDSARIASGDARAYNYLGTALGKLGRSEESILSFAKAIELKPNYAEAYNNRGVTMLKMGRYKEAVESLSMALNLGLESVYGHYNLGVALGKLGSSSKAIEHYNKAVLIMPEDIYSHYNLGVELVNQGRYDEAISHFSDVLRLKPHYNMHKMTLQRLEIVRQEKTNKHFNPSFIPSMQSP